jgi:dTDP-4-amino-4,6-dideoxygalactose transaminase
VHQRADAGWASSAPDCGELLSLPIGPTISDADVEHVIAAVRQACTALG